MLTAAWGGNLSTLKALQQRIGINRLQSAALCGVDPRSYTRWRSQGNPPLAALRLLAVVAGFLPWDGWEGWEMHRGCLFPPGYRKGGIAPGEFFALVFWRQQVSEYQRLNARLTEELAALRVRFEEATTPAPAVAPGALSGPDPLPLVNPAPSVGDALQPALDAGGALGAAA